MPIRARDLRVNIAELGFEKGVVHTLELALEDLSAMRQNLHDAAETMQLMSDNLEQFLKISEGLRSQLELFRRRQQQDEPDGKPGS
jgi:hypothetical protein